MVDVIAIIKSLGQTDDLLVEKQFIPAEKFEFLFENVNMFNCGPDVGLTLVFHADSSILESVQITLINAYEGSGEYNGELPYPFLHSMDRAIVRALMGEPDSAGGPEKIPVIGIVGGYDSYTYKLNEQYPNTEISFLYLADLRVHALIFEHIV
ncbi:hypothetical protein CKY10_11375 [Photorhabdus sp. HUG-39]|uniref:Immunity protein n=1 Tax=Photorhabdus kayaii TaxID=230088 RepID=A0ABX0AZN3_9GAMM|nr:MULTISPECIES: DUF6392 family protein [Photorhabdus]MCC8375174.1 hypothetical protein [Photorhabdus bodei]NDL12327.1 hypothetical protein [Photorhabdus kayaii]NDL25854.1 hypothetical protein [Photorhabdus kayaii]RAX09524.1 hypothetical protein CKY10_11375 [Photorhabdus sp. HUG-39]